MPRLSLGLGVQTIRKVGGGGGSAPITTSKAFNSSGVQVGDTITGSIPDSWVQEESTIAYVIFANNNSVTSIGNYAFSGCTSLTSITIPNSVTSIASYAFQNCVGLNNITLSNNVTSIGASTFQSCSILTNITIPTGITSIGSYAFMGCSNLASIICLVAQSAFIGSNAFDGTASPLVIQARITDASWTAGTGLSFQGNANVTVIKNL